jgi:hypothetical protein
MAESKKKQIAKTIDADLSLELDRSSMWWIPRLLQFSIALFGVSLVFSLISLSSLFFSDPLPFVRVITDSGVVVDVNAKQ